MSDFDYAVRCIKDDEGDLLLAKHEDYGPENIARAPGGPLMGLAVRLHDKVARLSHLLSKGGEPNYESVADTFIDIANYGTIGQLVLEGDWPGTEEYQNREERPSKQLSFDDILRDKLYRQYEERFLFPPVRVADHIKWDNLKSLRANDTTPLDAGEDYIL